MCACPGDVLTYTCTIEGGRSTVWSGSAFDCAGNEIVLHHNRFAGEGVTDECNNGTITAHSVRVEDNSHYTSQLNVTVSSGLHNKTVICSRDTEKPPTGEIRISVLTGRLKFESAAYKESMDS